MTELCQLKSDIQKCQAATAAADIIKSAGCLAPLKHRPFQFLVRFELDSGQGKWEDGCKPETQENQAIFVHPTVSRRMWPVCYSG